MGSAGTQGFRAIWSDVTRAVAVVAPALMPELPLLRWTAARRRPLRPLGGIGRLSGQCRHHRRLGYCFGGHQGSAFHIVVCKPCCLLVSLGLLVVHPSPHRRRALLHELLLKDELQQALVSPRLIALHPAYPVQSHAGHVGNIGLLGLPLFLTEFTPVGFRSKTVLKQ
ncbi:hypothetical protein FKM82_023824 [Ascaphus truei]